MHDKNYLKSQKPSLGTKMYSTCALMVEVETLWLHFEGTVMLMCCASIISHFYREVGCRSWKVPYVTLLTPFSQNHCQFHFIEMSKLVVAMDCTGWYV